MFSTEQIDFRSCGALYFRAGPIDLGLSMKHFPTNDVSRLKEQNAIIKGFFKVGVFFFHQIFFVLYFYLY